MIDAISKSLTALAWLSDEVETQKRRGKKNKKPDATTAATIPNAHTDKAKSLWKRIGINPLISDKYMKCGCKSFAVY